MKKSIIFALIALGVCVTSCKWRGGKVPVFGVFYGVAIDQNGNDLLDSTNVNSILDAGIRVKEYSSNGTLRSEMLLTKRNLREIEVKIGDKFVNYYSFNYDFFMSSVNDQYWVVCWDWSNKVSDKIEMKAQQRPSGETDMRMDLNLFCNSKLVWDNKDIVIEKRNDATPTFIHQFDI